MTLGAHYVMGRKKDPAKARQYFDALFKGNSYFAPEGGFALAQCWQCESKLDETKRTLEEVKRRFPSCKEKAERLLKLLPTSPKTK
jgi:TolA-binding protein